jgi:hypothetical protein
MNLKTEEALFNAQKAAQKVKELARKERIDKGPPEKAVLSESEAEESKPNQPTEPPILYEKQLIKLESEVRNHIKIE